ncbi:MAG: 4-alpha-glucanotransferase [Sulfuritalea sp.]|nr:4-alpha-glucanotransferase [Sulfuritalea sp.]
MMAERSSGILLHPTSLPGAYGAGDFGPEAYNFVDWLAAAGQSVWQVLPLGTIGRGNSAYMGSSAFAGNPLMIDLSDLGNRGWLGAKELRPDPMFQAGRVDFPLQFAFRIPRLRLAARHFFAHAAPHERSDFEAFCAAEQDWLPDYAIFMTLDAEYPGRKWNEWPAALAQRDPAALHQARRTHADEVAFWEFCQWVFARQWARLKHHANSRGIRIVGDVPIFVAYHSADVWARQTLFELDGQGRRLVVAGVPPDCFSASGQRWGNPLYRWSAHRADGYRWWIARMKRALALADIVRIDHFRGFAAHWEIPATEPSAVNGRWAPGPGKELFQALHDSFPGLPIIAEDLGLITPDVEELRDDFKLPGMRIVQFAFGEGASHSYLPHNYEVNTVAYTGTHDNDTLIGWWNTASPRERAFARHYLGTDGNSIQWSLMRALSISVARLVVFPMQDVLGLDGRGRMNVPGVPEGNWEWRFAWPEVQPWHAKVLREMGAVHGRCPFDGVSLHGD